jgi:hypothetical protein
MQFDSVPRLRRDEQLRKVDLRAALARADAGRVPSGAEVVSGCQARVHTVAARRVGFERGVHLRLRLHAVLQCPIVRVLDVVVAPADSERLRVEPPRERMGSAFARRLLCGRRLGRRPVLGERSHRERKRQERNERGKTRCASG